MHLVVQGLKLGLLMQEVWLQSLMGELISHMPHDQKPKHKQKQYCSKFDEDFKNAPHQENII